jgi:LytS/YehU family sensor histidine kinase
MLVASTVIFPALLHSFGITGQIFLPLYFFSLLGGLTYGWRCGLVVGLLSPIISFSISSMPALSLLPFVIIKSLSIGGLSGLLIEKYKNKNILFVILGSILFTQLIGIILIFSLTSNLNIALMDIKVGYPGILLQIVSIPFISQLILRHENKTSQKDY